MVSCIELYFCDAVSLFSEFSLPLCDYGLLALVQLSGTLRHPLESLLIVLIQLIILLFPVFTLIEATSVVHLQ